MELWDLLDINRNPIGKTHVRGDKMPANAYHIVVHAWIMSKSGKLLFTQRQLGKPKALLWERTGGSVLAGETSLQGAKREVSEELGIDLTNVKEYFIKSERRDRYHDFYDAWLFVLPQEVVPVLCSDEVKNYAWLTKEEADELNAQNLIVDTSRYYNEVLYLFNKIKTERR